VFFADADNDGTHDPEEAIVESATFIVAPAKTWGFTFDVSPVLVMNGQEFYGKTNPEITDLVQAEADRSLALARKKDSANDIRAAVAIALTPTTAFFSGASLPDPVIKDEEDGHYHNMPDDHIRFVNEYTGGTGVTLNWAMLGYGKAIIIDWTAHRPSTYAHELGHYTISTDELLSHHALLTNIMFGEANDSSKELEIDQARKYTGLEEP